MDSKDTKNRRDARPVLKPKPVDGILLDGSGSNWPLFERLYKEHVATTYGALVNELGAAADLSYQPQEPDGDKKSFGYMMALEEIKIRIKENGEFRANRPKLFGDMLQHISLTSERKVCQHVDFPTAQAQQSPRLLWDIIKATHIAPQHAGELGTWILRDKLTTCKQGHKPIEEHCRVFKEITEQLIALNDNQLTPEFATQTFLISLNGRVFGEELARWASANTLPTTLDVAMRRVMDWYRTTQNAIRHMGEDHAIRSETAFAADEKVLATAPKSKPKLHICPICNKKGSHAPQDCYELEKFCKESLHKRESKPAGRGCARPNLPPAAATAEPKPKSQHGKPAWSVFMSQAFAGGTYLDSGATTSLWKDQKDLLRTYPIKPVTLNGINGTTTVVTGGDHPIFGPVVLFPGCPANLISPRILRKMYKLEYHDEYDSFTKTESKFISMQTLKAFTKCGKTNSHSPRVPSNRMQSLRIRMKHQRSRRKHRAIRTKRQGIRMKHQGIRMKHQGFRKKRMQANKQNPSPRLRRPLPPCHYPPPQSRLPLMKFQERRTHVISAESQGM